MAEQQPSECTSELNKEEIELEEKRSALVEIEFDRLQQHLESPLWYYGILRLLLVLFDIKGD